MKIKHTFLLPQDVLLSSDSPDFPLLIKYDTNLLELLELNTAKNVYVFVNAV